jgi:HNH endonuclease
VTEPNPSGLCLCGCGNPAPIAPSSNANRCLVRGRPMRFISGHNLTPASTTGPLNNNWKGGKIKDNMGYVLIKLPEHPRAYKEGYVLEHILVCEKALGKSLPHKAIPHHVNENRSDNRPENLVICQDQAYHALLHMRMRALKACGHASWRKCCYCKQYDAPENLKIYKNGQSSSLACHSVCKNNYSKRQKRGY